MCGIVGYIGYREAYPVLIKGLHRLEYRGYDSAGVALLSGGKLNVYKSVGKVADLEAKTKNNDVSGTIGIAHTRWATHGEPSEKNAHPHVSESGNLCIVHNGIIENYAVIKQQLVERGYHFKSETDTEVLVQLIQYTFDQNKELTLLQAVGEALSKCIGAYAIAVLDKNESDRMVVARKGSPLVIGIGKDKKEYFIASDATPIVEYTKDVVYLEDGQIAQIECGREVEIFNSDKTQAELNVKKVDLNIDMLSKGGYPHFMLKEIFDQPECLRDSMRGRLLAGDNDIKLSCITNFRNRLFRAKRFIIVACGTSWHAGLIGKQLIENYCQIPVEVDYASEFRYRNPVVTKDDVVIAISQSGETADTLAAIELAKRKGAFIFGIVNAVGSSIARQTGTGIYIHVGPEIGVASTKAFTGQVLCLTLFTLAMGRELGTISVNDYTNMVHELETIPSKIEDILKENDKIAKLAKDFTYAHNFLYLGRGWNYPVALEGALKLKEISYIHAEGYPAAEMKHGPIALIDSNMPCMFVATHLKYSDGSESKDDNGGGKIISNMQEVKARGGRTISIVTKGDEEMIRNSDEYIEVPKTYPALAPLLSVIPLQLFAYHVAVNKGLDVDMPRNLAKSVTVE